MFVCIEIKVVNNKQIEKIDTDSPTAPRLMLILRQHNLEGQSDHFSEYIVWQISVHNRTLMMSRGVQKLKLTRICVCVCFKPSY